MNLRMTISAITLSAVLISALTAPCRAQVPIEDSKYVVTMISPAYFGPFAFPVPDILGGEVSGTLRAEIGADGAIGTIGGKDSKDYTIAPTFKVNIPLWTPRVNLSIWGEIHEFYNDSKKTRAARRVNPKYPLKGGDSGNIYISTDFLVLKEGKYWPSVALRATLQTATGDDYEKARHYDAPGYFFDASAGKTFNLGTAGDLRVSGAFGFVCWQIDRGRQNDAWLLAAKLAYSWKPLTVSAEYGRYSGWGRLDGPDKPKPGDCPKVIKGRLDLHFGRFSPFVAVQYGIKDYPFTRLSAGLAVEFSILSHS